MQAKKKQKPVSHEKSHGQEVDCDVVFTVP
jgi:hypothetical protein